MHALIRPDDIPPTRPVLIAGPTASGKSALALQIARAQKRPVVNADALQVYSDWRILTARPSEEEERQAPHLLYGHVGFGASYSVGDWLREVRELLDQRPIIIGGTGLYFRALTEGLAEIPPVPPEIRAEADQHSLASMLRELDRRDPVLAGRIDRNNRARVQRGWEVLHATKRPLSEWQAETGAPLLPLDRSFPLLLNVQAAWLNDRIERRFDQMLSMGALDEAKLNLPRWSEMGGARKAIGAPELMAYLGGDMSLDEARNRAVIATRQYAKRQRSWFRSNMKGWRQLDLSQT